MVPGIRGFKDSKTSPAKNTSEKHVNLRNNNMNYVATIEHAFSPIWAQTIESGVMSSVCQVVVSQGFQEQYIFILKYQECQVGRQPTIGLEKKK
jgi:hypothetical protein